MSIKINGLNKSFDKYIIFDNFSIEIPEGKITCILGPSGCGKTTLLNIIGKLIDADSGEFIGLDNKTISYLFQEPRLIKWKTVRDNIDFVLKDKFAKEEREKIISEHLEIVKLKDFENFYPDKLSGGMAQRVSIARAFAYKSNILLMDEPFKEIDLKLKISLINDFIKLWSKDKRTVIFVTHDIEEAIYIADEIFVLGSNPTLIKKKFIIDIEREQRNLRDVENYKIQKEIYDLVVE